MAAGGEQALVFGEGGLDLGVARQGAGVLHAQALSGFALGGQKIMYPMLRHDARGLLGEGAA